VPSATAEVSQARIASLRALQTFQIAKKMTDRASHAMIIVTA
jgi:hypothetical protein